MLNETGSPSYISDYINLDYNQISELHCEGIYLNMASGEKIYKFLLEDRDKVYQMITERMR